MRLPRVLPQLIDRGDGSRLLVARSPAGKAIVGKLASALVGSSDRTATGAHSSSSARLGSESTLTERAAWIVVQNGISLQSSSRTRNSLSVRVSSSQIQPEWREFALRDPTQSSGPFMGRGMVTASCFAFVIASQAAS